MLNSGGKSDDVLRDRRTWGCVLLRAVLVLRDGEWGLRRSILTQLLGNTENEGKVLQSSWEIILSLASADLYYRRISSPAN